MRIEIWLNYWSDEVLSFNPEKVIIRLRKYFPQVETDWKDQSRFWFEKFFQSVKEKGLEPPDFIIEDKWRLFAANSPTFLFRILTETNTEITGLSNRWQIEFESKQKFDSDTERTIIDFLKSLEYGKIKSNTQTEYFCRPHENIKDFWLLEESV
jgi:hypothetical protein